MSWRERVAKELLEIAEFSASLAIGVAAMWALPTLFGWDVLPIHWTTSALLLFWAVVFAVVALLIRARPLKALVDYLSATRGT